MELMPIDQVVDNEDRPVIDLWNKENKQSIYNLCPAQIRDNILDSNRRKAVQKYLDMDEFALKKAIRVIDPMLNRLRLSFWNEYYRAVDGRRNMRVKHIIGGICTAEKFHKLLCNDAKVAWILTPPADTVVALQETLAYGLDRVREILSLPLYRTESVRVGKDEFEDREVVDDKTAALMLKAVAMVDLRLHGGYVQVQKVEQKTININRNVNSQEVRNVKDASEVAQITDIDAKLAELRKEVEADMRKIDAPLTVPEARHLQNVGINPKELTARPHIVEVVDAEYVDQDVEDL